MTTLSPTMSLLALVKTGIILESPSLRLYKVNKTIVIERYIATIGGWDFEQEFPMTGAGLKQAIDYFNIPF